MANKIAFFSLQTKIASKITTRKTHLKMLYYIYYQGIMKSGTTKKIFSTNLVNLLLK